MDFRELEIRKIKADIPGIIYELYDTAEAKKIEEHFITEYTDLTITLIRKNAFYLYIYPYILMTAQNVPLYEIFGQIAQDYQTFEMPVVPGLN